MNARRLALTTLVSLCLGICGLASGAGPAAAAVTQFGSEGEGAGQFAGATGIAYSQATGGVYLVDTGNARAEAWGGGGEFVSAWGWGVADGAAAPETCTSQRAAGLEGASAGQFGARPEGVAVDNSLAFSRGDVYVADRANR